MWLIDQMSAEEFFSAKNGKVRPSPELLQPIVAAHAEMRERGENQSLTIAGSSADIRVEGVLTPKPDFWARLFGIANTSYSELQEAIAAVRNNASIKNVRVLVDSPGGHVTGLFETMEQFAELRQERKVEVLATNAHSAAYAIAAAAGPIKAVNDASSFGSVGAAVAFYVSPHVVEITNTVSPEKRPDVTTEEGKAVVRKYLDQVHEVIAKGIANGRGVSLDTVLEEYGRGATMVAREARRLGLIDGMARTSGRVPNSVRSESKQEAPVEERKEPAMEKMDLKALQEQHPSVYEAAVAIGRKEGTEAGVKQERSRVAALLKMADGAGGNDAVKLAHDAIIEGREINNELNAEFFSVSLANHRRTEHAQESAQVRDSLQGASRPHAKENIPSTPQQATAAAFRAAVGISG